MKKNYFLLVVTLFVTAISFSQVTELYFSKYAEGSSNNKFIEIYNGTSATISLDDYAFPSVSNDPTVVGEYEYWNTFAPGASIAPGDVYVVAHSSADAAILAQADMTFNFLSNGDDGMALVKGGVFTDANNDGVVDAGEMTGFQTLDWIGDWNGDPGAGWEVAGVADATKNHTLIRKSSVCGPNSSWDDARGYDAASDTTSAAASEWIVNAINSGWDVLGSYTGCQSNPTLSISSPADGSTISATTSVDIVFVADNFTIGAPGTGADGHVHYSTDNGATWTPYTTTAPIAMAVTPGNTYTMMLKLVDDSHADIVPAVTAQTTFTVALPCDLFLDVITTTCDAAATYTTTITFTGGGTAQYTLNASAGTVGGDDPALMATGTIEITGTPAGTNIVFTAVGDVQNSSCDLTRNITSPACVPATCTGVGSIIVTEIMKNPGVIADGAGEYFEVYNTTASDIDMIGWDLKDDGSNLHTIASSVIVPANGYAVFGINADTSTNNNVTVDYEYSGFNLSNGTDEVIIECSGTVIDAVFYSDADFPDTTGVSMELSTNYYDATANDNGANWCDATSAINGTTDMGTPNAANDCNVASVGSNEIEGFSIHPNPAKNIIYVNTLNNNAKNVEMFSIIGKRVYANTTVDNNFSVDVSKFNAGLYILKVSEGNNTSVQKVIIK